METSAEAALTAREEYKSLKRKFKSLSKVCL
jgi:hypothetical protein